MVVLSSDIVKQKIIGSNLPEVVKQQLVANLQFLGPNSLKFLNSRLSKLGIADKDIPVSEIISLSQENMQNLASGKYDEVANFLETATSNPDYGFGEYFIPFALDARDFIAKHGSKDSASLVEIVNKFESKNFEHIPFLELQEIIKNNLLYFIQNLPNIVLEFKRIYLLEEFSDDGTWGQNLRTALENNSEKLGQSNLSRDDKTYPPTVANWLKDYAAYINKPVSERVAFDQVQYIERAPNVQRLNAYERKDLLEIIKLHAWLMNPEVTEAEVEAYEAELAKRAAPVAITAPAEPVTPKPQPKPVMPEFKLKTPNDWVREASLRRAEEQRKIDAKIEELKHKKVGN